jgi:hypothetical protein
VADLVSAHCFALLARERWTGAGGQNTRPRAEGFQGAQRVRDVKFPSPQCRSRGLVWRTTPVTLGRPEGTNDKSGRQAGRSAAQALPLR